MTTITLPRATVEQTLEALKSCSGVPHWPALQPTIHALSTALAQQAEPVEPVGRVVSANCEYATVQWLKQTSDVGGGDPKNSRSWPIAGDAVYTAPPQLVPLTDEEIERICMTYQSPRQAARAVERALEEKNRGR